MCLFVSESHHPDLKPLIAEEDIEVIKFLVLPSIEHRPHFVKDKTQWIPFMNPLRTPFREVPVEFDENGECVMESELEKPQYASLSLYRIVSVGIHAYGKNRDNSSDWADIIQSYCLNFNGTPFKAYIPKGAQYYVGIDGDIVANKMIIKNERSFFHSIKK